MTKAAALPGDDNQTIFDDADFAALSESVARVLDDEADRLSLHRHIDDADRLDRAIWNKAVELGWPAVGLPEAHGGLGFGPRGLDILHRELGARTAPGSILASLTAAQAISEVADADVRSTWLPRLAAGECKLALAALVGTRAGARDAWILGDEDCEAALAPVRDGQWGLVPLDGAQVVEIWDRTNTMLRLDLAAARPLALLPGPATASALGRHFALALASDSIGGARAIVEQTVAYMQERQQFGRPIASFQALKHRVADLMTAVVSGEEIVSLAVDAAAAHHNDAGIWTALAKARVTDSYVRIVTDCLQLHGGVGFTWEFDVHLFLNRARLSEILLASNPELKDGAAAGLADSVRAGNDVLELAL